jgi:hypothetical protein
MSPHSRFWFAHSLTLRDGRNGWCAQKKYRTQLGANEQLLATIRNNRKLSHFHKTEIVFPVYTCLTQIHISFFLEFQSIEVFPNIWKW